MCCLEVPHLQRKCFGAINFVKITKESFYKANSLACFLAKRDTPVAATLQRESSGGINFCNNYKNYYKSKCSKELFCNNFGQDGKCQALRNPFSPHSIQKRPEPQICPNFVPTIVFRGSNQGDPNLSKICPKFENLSGNCRFSNFRHIFDKFGSPWLEPRTTIVGTNFLDQFGVRGVFECCKGKKGSQVKPWWIFSIGSFFGRRAL